MPGLPRLFVNVHSWNTRLIRFPVYLRTPDRLALTAALIRRHR